MVTTWLIPRLLSRGALQYQNSDGVIFSTEIALLYELIDQKPSLDLSYFAEYIINQNNALPTTPFQGIKELLPGMAFIIDQAGQSRQQLMWDIAALKSPYISDEKTFEEELLATLKSSVKAWTQDVDGVCLELSGGLDSSAVLITLRDVLPENKKLLAINVMDSTVPSSNECEFAQDVADVCNVPLHFIDSATVQLISDLPADWLPDRPTTLLTAYQSSKKSYAFAQQHGDLEVMSGQGGDHVFLAPQPKEALADYWFDHGFKGITTPLKELSGAARTSWGELGYENIQAIMNYYRKKITKGFEHPRAFLAPEFARSLQENNFYLDSHLTRFYPAKALHIKSLAHAVFFAERDRWVPQAVMTHPLLSLPLVKLGLKIPTYQSFACGYDRIFFRRVASSMKHSKALWRTIKGQTTGTAVKTFMQEIEVITDLLVQGTLVKSGMINRQWLDSELIKMRHGHLDNMWPVWHLLTSQLWIRQWKQ